MYSTNSSVMENYKKEIEEISLLGTGKLIPPYQESQSIDEKILATQIALRKTIRNKDRLMALINAYYLGRLINESESTSVRYQRKRKINTSYCIMSEYTYDIFEMDPSQLLGTSNINVQGIKKLKRSQVLALRRIIEEKVYTAQETFRFSQELENLEEENC